MKQKFLILAYSFHGKFQADENGPAALKQYISLEALGPLILDTLDTLEECEIFLRHYKGHDALFVLPIFELDRN